MKQKTLKFKYADNYAEYLEHEGFKVGDEVVLVEVSWDTEDGGYWYLQREPVSGNMDPGIKRYHGWRGSTDGKSKYAHGLRKIKSIEITGDVCDETMKIVVGPDLHPEWD